MIRYFIAVFVVFGVAGAALAIKLTAPAHHHAAATPHKVHKAHKLLVPGYPVTTLLACGRSAKTHLPVCYVTRADGKECWEIWLDPSTGVPALSARIKSSACGLKPAVKPKKAPPEHGPAA